MDIPTILTKQREYFQSGETKDCRFRLMQLKKLRQAIDTNKDQILWALKQDLNKDPFEAYETEVGVVRQELNHLILHLPKWVAPQKTKTPWIHFPSTSFRLSEPYGVVLIMSPWNYPFLLTFAPLAGALAAGNCVVIKPSRYASATSKVMCQMIKDCFEDHYVTAFEGGREVNEALLEERFDYLFFTGSVGVGRKVMEAAALHLTPVTLELGGKSPCIVCADADLRQSARRIVWGKFLNAGQTCVAPDYVVVHQDVKADLITQMVQIIETFYTKDPCHHEKYPKIINRKHYDRLMGLMDCGRIVIGGTGNEATLQIAPTILDPIHWDDKVMQDEIFGPILPVLTFQELSQVIDEIRKRPKPLALYLFTKDKRTEKKIQNDLSFGGGCVNDTVVHLASPYLPFGGVGESGMGQYHGKASFDTFTHYKSILKKSTRIDIPLRYPPYTPQKLKWLTKFMR